jgi:hypothetical protein
MVGLSGSVGVRDLEPEAGVEGHGGVQVRHDKVVVVRFRASHEEPPSLNSAIAPSATLGILSIPITLTDATLQSSPNAG